MFSKELSSITLVNDIADRLFDNITAASFGADKTFTATLRAVLPGRLPAHESLNLALVPLGNNENSFNVLSTDAIMKGIADTIRQYDMGHSYTVYVVYPGYQNVGKQLIDVVRANAGRYFIGYTNQEDLRLFYIRMLDGLFYVGSHGAFIFLDCLDIRRFHALQMMIPKYLPRLFADNPLSPEETSLLKSLALRTHAEYERLIEQFAQRLDMRGEIIRTRLRGFEPSFERTKLDEVTRAITTLQQEYELHLDNLRRTLNEIQERQIILAGLQCRIGGDGGDSELMEYFLCNKQLSIIRVSGTELEFVVHGYADIYDEDAFDTYAGNLNSYFYDELGGGVSKEQMQRLYRAIFSDGGYKLRLCAAYRADMKNSIKPVQEYIFPPESQNYLPNPHIQHYGCIGGYASRFVEYMSRRDYVGAIDQAAVSARNLNFHDSPVIGTLAHTLSRTTIKCIEDTDGTLMTPREAIKKLEDEAGCQDPSQ